VGAVHLPLTPEQQERLAQPPKPKPFTFAQENPYPMHSLTEPTPTKANGCQVDGDHYKGKAMQPWDIIEAWDLDFFEGSALAYLLRKKPGVSRATDLRKAIHYLEKCVEREEQA
jgi:hypothetical protein